jgi:lipopolysaccharide/colanic/teichoic acid biosynthesis glycosyltransferase
MKRIFDLTVATFGLLTLSPFLLILVAFIRVSMGGPVLFTQIRPGLKGKPFKLIKFRTMKDGKEPDHQRITKFGHILRATSLDEFPELINVIKGEMSLVGPRPLLMEYLPLYTPEQNRRHDVLPGITGWAQINGRNALSWEEKFKLDLWYVENQSFSIDLRILFLTVYKVFKREGVNHDKDVTMTKFTGSKKDYAA